MNTPIVLHPEPAATAPCPAHDGREGSGGCASCSHSPLVPSRLAQALPRCDTPELLGPPEQVATALAAVEAALRQALQMGDSAQVPTPDPTGLVRRLEAQGDEVSLTLTVSQRCGGGWLADVAFQALRQQLHDTDVYVFCQPD